MSANNGVYILKLHDKFLVKKCNNIEYIYEKDRKIFEEPQIENTSYEFSDAKGFDKYIDAVIYAHELYNKIIKTDICEYGIQEISLNAKYSEIR